jgi:hypothetical protein
MFHSFGDPPGIVAGGLRKHKEELVASVAPEEIVGAKTGGDDFDDLPEAASPAAWPAVSLMCLK